MIGSDSRGISSCVVGVRLGASGARVRGGGASDVQLQGALHRRCSDTLLDTRRQGGLYKKGPDGRGNRSDKG